MIMFVNGMIDHVPVMEGCNNIKKIFLKQFGLFIFAD